MEISSEVIIVYVAIFMAGMITTRASLEKGQGWYRCLLGGLFPVFLSAIVCKDFSGGEWYQDPWVAFGAAGIMGIACLDYKKISRWLITQAMKALQRLWGISKDSNDEKDED